MRTLGAAALLALSVLALTPACSKEGAGDAKDKPATEAKPVEAPAAEAKKPAAPPVAAAVVGQPAPDFKLKDLAGNEVSLAALRGKTVVLEWFNPKCPFVIASHTKGGLVNTARKHTDAGVVWLAINSGAPGKQGHELALNEEGVKTFGMTHPVLRDETGTVGRAYGATNTPHMFVVDKAGTLVYAGAIDNSPDGEGASPKDGQLVNHVDAALEEPAAGRPVPVPTPKAHRGGGGGVRASPLGGDEMATGGTGEELPRLLQGTARRRVPRHQVAGWQRSLRLSRLLQPTPPRPQRSTGRRRRTDAAVWASWAGPTPCWRSVSPTTAPRASTSAAS